MFKILDSAVRVGDVREIAATLPHNSIDCIITSPPYWALRHYGTDPVVWDGDPAHDHCWNSGKMIRQRPKRDHDGRNHFSDTRSTEPQRANTSFQVTGQFCSCGAWRGELGLEPTYNLFIKHLVGIFDLLRPALKPTGALWVNLGDTYGGSCGASGHTENSTNMGHVTSGYGAVDSSAMKGSLAPKSLLNIPARFAIAMTDNGWILRNEIIWHKPNCMPSSASDRFTVDFGKLFFFTKSQKYYFDQQREPLRGSTLLRRDQDLKHQAGSMRGAGGAKKTPMKTFGDVTAGRNARCVWRISTKGYKEAHFATYPPDLSKIPILSTCPDAVCSHCGRPKKRIITRKSNWPDRKVAGAPAKHGFDGAASYGDNHFNSEIVSIKTIPMCSCRADFIPGIVYDPFGGSGSTGAMAKALGRRYLISNIKDEYCQLARKRIRSFHLHKTAAPKKVDLPGQRTIFDVIGEPA